MFDSIFPKWVRMLFPSMMGLSFGGGDDSGTTVTQTEPTFKQLPDYAESEGARGNWWETLQKWQNEPGYGAIAPNWNDIWENAKGKVQRYFQGGPEGPGAIASVKSGLARRNASEDPASATAISRLNMQQGNQLQDMAVQQAIQEATLGESGRKTWLASLQDLSGQKPAFVQGSNVVQTKTGGNDTSNLGKLTGNLLMGGGSGGITSLFGGGGAGTTDKFLSQDELIRQNSMNKDASGIGSIASMFGGGGDGGDDWWKQLLKIGAVAGGTYFGGPMGGAAAGAGANALL